MKFKELFTEVEELTEETTLETHLRVLIENMHNMPGFKSLEVDTEDYKMTFVYSSMAKAKTAFRYYEDRLKEFMDYASVGYGNRAGGTIKKEYRTELKAMLKRLEKGK